LSYECGYHFEHFDGVDLAPQDFPLAWFGLYERPVIFDHVQGRFEGAALPSHKDVAVETTGRFAESVTLAIPEEEYRSKILRIKDYILAGETYQVNFTDRVSVSTSLSAAAAFAALSKRQPVAYSAFMNVEGRHILSLSPELFFRIGEGRIVTRPMKGTMPRGMDLVGDAEAAVRLRNDEKNCSEHIMIVDLLRNDVGRICAMGSVTVTEMFSVERYETLLQMTSTVSGRLRPGLSYYDIFKGMFPSGSITGAPKIRTMQIIRELEAKPRGVYTGAIGFMAPGGESVFNVAIRTLVLKDGVATMGVGGGIVADSDPGEEYRECLLKAAFLTRERQDFRLIETMLWDGAVALLAMHLDRLESSAAYFGFGFDRVAVVAELEKLREGLQSGERYRLRLLLDLAGGVTISVVKLDEGSWNGSVRLSKERTSSTDLLLRHKTTHRELYEREYALARGDGFDEVIFFNERGEVTEGAISNILVRKDGRLLTPPVDCGVLPGVYRRHLLESDATAVECVLTLEDLEKADAVFLCNSVRGLRVVKRIA